MASGIAHRLFCSHLRVAMTEIDRPLAVRRAVSFCEAVWDGSCQVEGITGQRAETADALDDILSGGAIPILVDPALDCLKSWQPHVLIDATLAKRNLGITQDMAELVIGFGPGFCAGRDVDVVVETNRGHDLGRLITAGEAMPNTGVPATTAGYSVERVLRAPAEGVFEARCEIGTLVKASQVVGLVGTSEVRTKIPGVLRGLIRSGVCVGEGLKVGDVDPRGELPYCWTISEKARALGGSALEAILDRFNN
jgi:xanthine dehydrogenase accessory factor